MGRKGVTADVSHRKAERSDASMSRWAPPLSSFLGDVAPDSDRSAGFASSAVPSSVLVKPPKRGRKPRKRIARRVRVAQVSAKRGQVIKADREWAEKVKAGGTCKLCPYPATDAHHVYGKKAYPRLRYDLDNGIALCRLNHDMWHRYPGSHLDWFAREYPTRWKRLQAKVQREARLS